MFYVFVEGKIAYGSSIEAEAMEWAADYTKKEKKACVVCERIAIISYGLIVESVNDGVYKVDSR